MYKIYYCRQAVGDVLLISYDEETIPNKIKRNDNVISLYKDDKLVGINIFDFSKIVKIFHSGEIVDPTDEFITLINHILINAGANKLKENE